MVNKEISGKLSFTLTFTFYSTPSKNINQIFGCGGSFPFYIVAQNFESKTLGRVAASNSKKTKNRFQGGEGRRSVLIMRHHQVLLVYQLTHFYLYFYAWLENISLSYSRYNSKSYQLATYRHFWNKNASSRIRSARLKSSLSWSILVWSSLV